MCLPQTEQPGAWHQPFSVRRRQRAEVSAEHHTLSWNVVVGITLYTMDVLCVLSIDNAAILVGAAGATLAATRRQRIGERMQSILLHDIVFWHYLCLYRRDHELPRPPIAAELELHPRHHVSVHLIHRQWGTCMAVFGPHSMEHRNSEHSEFARHMAQVIRNTQGKPVQTETARLSTRNTEMMHDKAVNVRVHGRCVKPLCQPVVRNLQRPRGTYMLNLVHTLPNYTQGTSYTRPLRAAQGRSSSVCLADLREPRRSSAAQHWSWHILKRTRGADVRKA